MMGQTAAVLVALLGAHAMAAQDASRALKLADRGPRFYYSRDDGALGDARGAAVLKTTVALDLTNTPLGDALATIGQAAHVHIVSRADLLPAGVTVSIRAEKITLAAALTDVLQDVAVDVELTGSGILTVVRRASPDAPIRQPAGTTLLGQVTDAVTRAPVAHANVRLDSARLGAVADAQGRYAIAGLAPGAYRVTARRLGYTSLTKIVQVTADSTAVHLDFALTASPLKLEEVVTTVTGDEERYRVGNLIETMHADSVVRVAPVTNLGDVLNARIPGVQIFQPGGTTGASPSINIRGQNSLTLSNQPLLVIDGVRSDNSAATDVYGDPSNPNASIGYTGGSGSALPFGSFYGGRFNDLNPEDIETIEVVKGPSAATLYGTDAANGVILVTTKRGAPGAPRWDLSVEEGALTLNTDRFTEPWHAWGHSTPGNTPEQCTLLMKAAGSCAVDSITHFSPLRDPALTPVGTGNRERYAAQVSGGVAQTRFFVSGTYEGEVSPLELPSADRTILLRERGSAGLEPDNTHPNALTKGSGRANFSTTLGGVFDLSISSALLSQEVRIPNSTFWYTGQEAPGYKDANDGWFFGLRPASVFDLRNREDVTHSTGGATGAWHPTPWLQSHVTTGIDYSSDYLDFLARPGEQTFYPTGQRTNGRVNVALYTVDLGATASELIGSAVSSKSSIGAQYNHRSEVDNAAVATNLAPGVLTVSGGAVQLTTEANVETIVTGGYVEQTFGYRDRLFLTGGLRVDGGSAFGAAFKTQLYPKVSGTWLLSREPWMPALPGVSSFRLRAAYGSSGVQPGPTAALSQVTPSPATTLGGTATGAVLGALGNPHLKPETQTEFEGGADLEAASGRIQLAATYYNKRSSNALITLPLATQLGIGSTQNSFSVNDAYQEINIGAVRNLGYEISADVQIVRSRPIDWSVGVNGSNNQNRLLHLAPGITSTNFGGSLVGYPLFGLWDIPYTFTDRNHDGVIEPNEVAYAPAPVFLGSSYPTAQVTFQTTLGVWRDVLQLHVQVDRRSGVMLADYIRNIQPYFGTAEAQNDPHASLSDQAAAQAFLGPAHSSAGYDEDASFTRLREVSLTFTVPPRLARALRARTASVTIAGRNLALWTRYRGADPEVNSAPTGALGGSGGVAYYDYGAAPVSHYWIVRASLGL